MTKPVSRINKTAIKIIAVCLVSLLILWIMVDLIVSNTAITVSHHSLESEKIAEPLRLAVVTDLHSKEFGKDNSRLIEKIKEQQPDLILTVGDLIERKVDNEENLSYLSNLISQLSHIAPVYSCIGNQERDNENREAIENVMTSSGAKLYDLTHQDITVKGNRIHIGGLSYYRRWDEEANAYLQDYVSADDECFTLFLCHHPELYLWGIDRYPLDLMVSGHTHGGMIRLPFVGALYAPEQGKFPEYTGGFYEMELGHLAVCKGLGSSPEYVPRFHNPPELMIIDLL